MYLWPAARGGGVDRVEVPGAANMRPGQSLMLQVGGKAVIVVRQRDGFKAFDASCTHLGCLVRWDQSSGEFRCPCHAAVFDADGRVVSGPPPAPMPVFAVREIGDQVFVSPA
jgi:Rieske Fe-S protein